jgi:aspartate oxidase
VDGRITGNRVDLRADFLIIGSGIAALRAAAELSGAGDILILTKAEPEEGNTGYAQGGIAAAMGADDSFTSPTRSRPATACATRRRYACSSKRALATCVS